MTTSAQARSATSTSTNFTIPNVKLLINGELVESATTQWRDIVNPATQEVLARVPFATPNEIHAAVSSAKRAFKTWRKTPIGARARVFLKYQQLIRENMKELAAILTAEQGKTLAWKSSSMPPTSAACKWVSWRIMSPTVSIPIPCSNRWAYAPVSRHSISPR